jgi:invasion protein IalB
MIYRIFKIIIIIFFTLNITKIYAKEQDNTIHGKYLDWTVFTSKNQQKEDSLICYMVAIPIKNIKNIQQRGEAHFTITKTAEKLPEISIANGYYYKQNTEAEISFGIKKFNLMTYKTKAWTYDASDDIEIVKSLKLHDNFTVTASSKINKITQDEYSLIGFNKAYKKLLEICP